MKAFEGDIDAEIQAILAIENGTTEVTKSPAMLKAMIAHLRKAQTTFPCCDCREPVTVTAVRCGKCTMVAIEDAVKAP